MALSVFVEPPSIEELKDRLEKRATDHPEVIKDRIAKAEFEMTFAPRFDVVIRNEDLSVAKAEVLSVVSKFLKE